VAAARRSYGLGMTKTSAPGECCTGDGAPSEEVLGGLAEGDDDELGFHGVQLRGEELLGRCATTHLRIVSVKCQSLLYAPAVPAAPVIPARTQKNSGG
jgi:hypothetical protein